MRKVSQNAVNSFLNALKFREGNTTVEDYADVWFYPDYMISSFAEILLRDKKVIFKKV